MPDNSSIPKISENTFERGSVTSAPTDIAPNYLAKGSENAVLTGTGKVSVFKGATQKQGVSGGGVMMNVAETYASLGANNETAYGNVFNVFAALFFIGAGLLRLTGQSLLVSASSTLSLLIKRNGVYTDPASGLFQAGLAQPSAPIILAVTPPAGLTGKNNGTVSVVIWRVRSTTGARSIKSAVSNIVGAINQSISITFPLKDTNGQDFWGIGVTKNIEGAIGSHFELKEIPETSVAASPTRAVVIEWRDGDLAGKPFAPSRDFPPSAGLFGGTLEDVSFVDGAYADAVRSVTDSVRGSAITPSERGRPESFSPDTAIFTNDTPTALLRGDGLYWRFGRNSLNVIRYLGGEKPLSVETVWDGTGVSHQHNACLGEGGRLYAWTGIPTRLGADGLPDSSFANPIIEDFAAWTDSSKVVLGSHNVKFSGIAFCYEQTIRVYYPSLDAWSAPLKPNITGNIKSCVTDRNQLLISTTDGTIDRLYEYNVGTGTTAKIQSGWTPAREFLETVHSCVATVRADNTLPITIEILADGIDTPAETMTVTPARTGFQRLLPIYPNVIDCEQTAVRITITSTTATGDAGVESVSLFGSGNSIMQ